jgi:hypothetical protein
VQKTQAHKAPARGLARPFFDRSWFLGDVAVQKIAERARSPTKQMPVLFFFALQTDSGDAAHWSSSQPEQRLLQLCLVQPVQASALVFSGSRSEQFVQAGGGVAPHTGVVDRWRSSAPRRMA